MTVKLPVLWNETPTQQLTQRLLEICLERGGKDNITIIAVDAQRDTP